jgi:chemotaxis protein CheX
MDARIMVVNISPAFGKILRKFFQDGGFEVLVAKDALEACQLFIKHGADLVLTDYYLPQITGGELVRTFRSNDQHRNLPMVVFTSSDDPEIIQDCEDAGASLILDKGMEHDVLLEEVRRLVEEYKETLMSDGLDSDLQASTTAATAEVMQTMMQMSVRPVRTTFKKVEAQQAEVIGSVGIAGVLSGNISIFLSRELARIVTAKMLMMEPEDITSDEELVDAVGEMANMIAGNIKTHLFKKIPLFDIATPAVTIGQDMRRSSVADQLCLLSVFEWEGHEFMVEFLLVSRDQKDQEVILHVMQNQGLETGAPA